LHPGCVAFARAPPRRRSEWAALPQWFLYKEMVLSSQVFLRDCSAVSPEQVVLFGGSRVTDAPAPVVTQSETDASSEPPLLGADGAPVELSASAASSSSSAPMAALLDAWIVVSSSCADTSELLLDVRRELDAATAHKVMHPRRPLPKASSEIIDAVAATMHIVDAREAASLARLRRAESPSGAYDRFANRDGFGERESNRGRDGSFFDRSRSVGSERNRPGFDRPNRVGFGKPRGRAAGRLRRDADGNFVRTPAKGDQSDL
jgi:ATP-dependent RNA helicase DHX36